VNAAAAELHADGVHLERWLDSTSMVRMPERPRPTFGQARGQPGRRNCRDLRL